MLPSSRKADLVAQHQKWKDVSGGIPREPPLPAAEYSHPSSR